MYKILRKKVLSPVVTLMDIDAPFVARKAEAGQFIILRVSEDGERIPLTISGYDREKGIVRIIFQIIGSSTALLNAKKEGEYISDFVGPLGKATKTDGIKKVAIVGGGVLLTILDNLVGLYVALLNENVCDCLFHLGCRNVNSCVLCIICISDSGEHIGDYI